MTITGIIITIIVGLIIGALGRLVVPGRQPIPIWLTIIVGIVASFIGHSLAPRFTVDRSTPVPPSVFAPAGVTKRWRRRAWGSQRVRARRQPGRPSPCGAAN